MRNYPEYKNNILQLHHCPKCGEVWDENGEQVAEEHKFMYTDKESYNVVTCLCPMCQNITKNEKK